MAWLNLFMYKIVGRDNRSIIPTHIFGDRSVSFATPDRAIAAVPTHHVKIILRLERVLGSHH
jgi:hypothetical protein